MNNLRDPHGALGVWPAAYAATAQLAKRRDAPRVLELGAGAGLPSLYASLVLRSPRVVATDVEAVPLRFLRAARAAHAPAASPEAFDTKIVDVCAAAEDDLAGFDVVVAADMLYDREVAASLGSLLGAAVAGGDGPDLVVCDPGRRGRDDFLDAFAAASGFLDARFVERSVPEHCTDVFDGSRCPAVGVLLYA